MKDIERMITMYAEAGAEFRNGQDILLKKEAAAKYRGHSLRLTDA